MRISLVLVAATAALFASPAVSQEALPAVLTEVDALALRDACIRLATNDAGAAEAVTAAGWKVEVMPGASTYSKTEYGQLRFKTAGPGALLWTTETYPGYRYGFCRLDFPRLEGPLGLSGLAADASYKIESSSGAAGYDAAWSRDVDGVRTLIVGHEDAQVFALQVTVIAETAQP